jgi:hypothetical protein
MIEYDMTEAKVLLQSAAGMLSRLDAPMSAPKLANELLEQIGSLAAVGGIAFTKDPTMPRALVVTNKGSAQIIYNPSTGAFDVMLGNIVSDSRTFAIENDRFVSDEREDYLVPTPGQPKHNYRSAVAVLIESAIKALRLQRPS